jgi:putative Holliday junction resolvase
MYDAFQFMIKPNNPKIMSLDIGATRTGIAITDALGITAQPLMTVEHKTLKELFVHIKNLVLQEGVVQIIIGLPKELNGKVGEHAKKIMQLSKRLKFFLKNEINDQKIELILWDERFTTCQAERVVIGSRLKNKDKSAALDKISAAIILDSYLNSIK